MRDQFRWARLLAFVTGLVNQELLLRNEYLAAENRILRAHLPSRPWAGIGLAQKVWTHIITRWCYINMRCFN